MSQTTILIIDDSATIRRLADSHLSQAGYRVVMAANAEDGVRMASEILPDMILLDHQLPGTTGFQVCQQLLESAELSKIPVVVSSTLRKKAYAEYTELPNVVDMLPKPYTPDLLKTTVANALDTGCLIVQSQSQGTAVPEVIQEVADSSLSGSFQVFSLRDVLDFLNNGVKQGVLEVETIHDRIWFYLKDGRIQAVTAPSVDPQELAQGLPDTLRDLAPVLNFTSGGRFCSEVDGLVELLDRKVLDPRLLRRLLRHQAALLTRRGFTTQLKSFHFQAGADIPPLFRKLPLDVSLVALLVDGALACRPDELPDEADGAVYVRRALRGQNLDRAGLSAEHMKVLAPLANPLSSDKLSEQLGMSHDEVRRVLHGLTLAELVEAKINMQTRFVIALEDDVAGQQQLRDFFAKFASRYSGKVVRDGLALQLLLKRNRPDVLLLPAANPDVWRAADQLLGTDDPTVRHVAIVPQGSRGDAERDGLAGTLERPYQADQVCELLDELFSHAAELETASIA